MKNSYLMAVGAIVLLATSGCEKQSSAAARKIAELEQKTQVAADRQRELEQELANQKLASERDAVERERMRIEEDRAELERRQGAAIAEQDEALREREEALANREGKLEQFQSALEEKEDEMHDRSEQLSEVDRELAGREALAFEESAPSDSVADYGMFYDSLASYGSWFETPDYGYVWQPVVVSDSRWRPYLRGRWICSDRGWTWVSDEPFGWATYHYGRWALLRDRGWIWVPGSEWAPCWVSWRENNSHIGWAPLPPETLAYRGHTWDSAVDVQFGISASCYNFVEARYFGNSLSSYCLPVSGNGGYFQLTSNITYIHIVNRQVICGGPKYKKVCEAVRKPLPFYRLEIDHHPRPSRDSLGMRPRVKDGRLLVSAPNMDVAWNDSLRPKRIKDRIETVTVERSGALGKEITDRYRQSREEARQRSVREDSRRPAHREIQENPPQREVAGNREPERAARPIQTDQVPGRAVGQTRETRPQSELLDERRNSVNQDPPQVTPAETADLRPESGATGPAEDRRISRTDAPTKTVETARVRQRQDGGDPGQRREVMDESREEQAPNKQRQERQNGAEQARLVQQEATKRKQEQQAEQQQQRMQREADQTRERQQQELAQQREQERSRRQQQEDQQREERAQQRQEEESRQRQHEQARQRQQEENEREQERARQRQQEDNQRQRQQEESRQKQEKEEKDQDDQRKRNR